MNHSHKLTLLAFLCLLRTVAGQTSQQPPGAPSPSAAKPAPLPKVSYGSVHIAEPYVAITFDDGPDPTLTPKLLDLLAEKKIKATFFVLGPAAQSHPEILKRMIAEGHEIGNHSWTHPVLAKMGNASVHNELQKTDDVILKATGSRPKLMRPPYGELTKTQRQWVHSEFGYKIILWDVDPLDWKEPGPSVVAQRIIKEAKPGSIILSHDIHAQTVAAMPEVFDALLAKGFKFVTVSELLALPQIIPTPTPAPSAPVNSATTGTLAPSATPSKMATP